jgi:hypothetical protein
MKRAKRALLTTAAAATLVVVGASGTALAAPPQGVPNSGASGNCIATSSGILFFEKEGIRLGKDVSRFAPHGGQRDFVQGQQASCGGQARQGPSIP